MVVTLAKVYQAHQENQANRKLGVFLMLTAMTQSSFSEAHPDLMVTKVQMDEQDNQVQQVLQGQLDLPEVMEL